MKEIADEALARRAVGRARRRLAAARRETAPWTSGRDVRWDDAVAGQPGELPPPRSTPSTPTCSRTRRARPGGRRAPLHVHGGFLVSIAREVAYQTDVHAGDRIHFATDMGWIMGPWTVVGGGALGATVVFAEGAPDWPDDRLWRLVESRARDHARPLADARARADPEGRAARPTSPRCGRSRRPASRGTRPRTAGCTSTSAAAAASRSSTSRGGTEVGACFLSVCVAEPIKAVLARLPRARRGHGRRRRRTGRPLRGEVGELVCRRPWPGMTRGIWGDPERYLETYWRRFPGVWTHGDWASIDEDGYWYLHGRSDDTLNIAGKRIGPAELESAAVGARRPWPRRPRSASRTR